eukprot:TRINITY_DN8256_c0_g1_i25.p1 TRINITY_DN8256_c0_g1~~TRINITY_DN8256_c0_g1_i25.p1  ORF type:complete len:147 (-),score=49.45 TRINITY_DN8256_c0_g1_i25:74-514(-)
MGSNIGKSTHWTNKRIVSALSASLLVLIIISYNPVDLALASWKAVLIGIIKPCLFLLTLLPLVEPFVKVVGTLMGKVLFRLLAVGIFAGLAVLSFLFHIPFEPHYVFMGSLKLLILELVLVVVSYWFTVFKESLRESAEPATTPEP